MNATTKFYAGFFVALAIVIAISVFVGYHMGRGAAAKPLAANHLPAYAACLRKVKADVIASHATPSQKFYSFSLSADDCAARFDVPHANPRDIYEMTGVRVGGAGSDVAGEGVWRHPDAPPHTPSALSGPSGMR